MSKLKIVTHLGCLIPIVWLIVDWMRNDLTANPIQELTFRTGKPALILLILSLVVTPTRRILKVKAIAPLRRILGLYAFMFASLHFSIFVGLDYFFDWELIKLAIAEKPYILLGFSAYLLLLALALTSTKASQKKLKKWWRRIHYLVYAAITFVILHFIWLVKSDVREPLIYGFMVAFLLILRIPYINKRLMMAVNRE